MSDETIAGDRESILVAFAGLTNEQREVIDAHPLRGPGAFIPSIHGHLLATFWVADGSTTEATFDDLRGWALGQGIPIEQRIEP